MLEAREIKSADEIALLNRAAAMVDGVASTDLMTVLLDTEHDPPRPPAAAWTPSPGPSAARLLGDALVEQAVNPFAAAERLAGAVTAPRQFAGLLEDVGRGLIGFAGVARPRGSSLNGPLGPHRRVGRSLESLRQFALRRNALHFRPRGHRHA